MPKRIFLTDKEVATVLEVSTKTLYRMLVNQSVVTCKCGSKINIREAAPESVQGSRRWRLSRLASVLGVSPEDIERRL